MATAYAAFTSLMHLISDLHEHSYPPIRIDEEHFDSLNSKISFFQKFLEDHHTSIDLKLELRLADAAYAAEDIIETHIADRVLNQVDFNGRLQKAIEAMDQIEEEVKKVNWNNEKELQGNNSQPRLLQLPRPGATTAAAAANSCGSEKNNDVVANSGGSEKNNNVVGMEDLTLKIVDKLAPTQSTSRRQIFSITGMGGIGKTTLANNVYNHPYVRNYFHVRAWATISKDYNVHKSLVELVHCLDSKQSKDTLRGEGEEKLGEQLRKSLFGKRYLIVLDDLWDVDAWFRLRSSFPDSPGSRIVITTRESKFDSISSHVFNVGLLDESQSWELFCRTVFGQDDCPGELEDVGRKISYNCRGLPLSVVVIGGHLAKSPRTQRYWKYIATNSFVKSKVASRCLKILSLSYVNLPIHLKPCYLYMGIFGEDKEVFAEKLIKLWVAEGFVKPIPGKSLEEAAQSYLNDLVGRNLIIVVTSSRRGEIIKCKIHDRLRDFCLQEALQRKFLSIVQKKKEKEKEKEEKKKKKKKKVPHNGRRVVLYSSSNEVDQPTVRNSGSVIRTLIVHGALLPSAVYKSLRVLASTKYMKVKVKVMVEVAPQLVNLRCLNFSSSKKKICVEFPSTITSMWNLQSLSIAGCKKATIPEEIWKMTQLRHISIERSLSLSEPPPPSESHGGEIILKNLRSAQMLLNFSFSEDSVKRIPNVGILAVMYDGAAAPASRGGFGEEGKYSLENIERLEKLEKLYCWLPSVRSLEPRNGMVSSLAFPHSLKELRVSGLCLDDKIMSKIGSLPLLEELYLEECSGGSKWELVEGKFVRLKYLHLFSCNDLKCFAADSSHFPCLEELKLSHMDSLEKMPSSDIGDIETLRLIELWKCRDSAVECAEEIAKYQKDEYGNEDLQIRVCLHDESKLTAKSLSLSKSFNVRAEEW